VENEENAIECKFCTALLHAKRPALKNVITLEDAELPFQELSEFHTYDLLVLLRLVREQRTSTYYMMRSVQRTPDAFDVETISFTEGEYRRFTARMKVLEGILIDRMGYKPKRVDDKLLLSLKSKIEKDRKG